MTAALLSSYPGRGASLSSVAEKGSLIQGKATAFGSLEMLLSSATDGRVPRSNGAAVIFITSPKKH